MRNAKFNIRGKQLFNLALGERFPPTLVTPFFVIPVKLSPSYMFSSIEITAFMYEFFE